MSVFTEAETKSSKKQNKNRPNNLAWKITQQKKEKKIEADITRNAS